MPESKKEKFAKVAAHFRELADRLETGEAAGIFLITVSPTESARSVWFENTQTGYELLGRVEAAKVDVARNMAENDR